MADEVRVTSATGGEKGSKEARFDLIPVGPLTQLARLYGRGAEKYAARNWERGYDWSLSYAAAQRHMTQFWAGEDLDEEMGLPHPVCAMFHMAALTQFLEQHPEFDDRPKPPVKFDDRPKPPVKFDMAQQIADIYAARRILGTNPA